MRLFLWFIRSCHAQSFLSNTGKSARALLHAVMLAVIYLKKAEDEHGKDIESDSRPQISNINRKATQIQRQLESVLAIEYLFNINVYKLLLYTIIYVSHFGNICMSV